jgi:hypothetical protein
MSRNQLELSVSRTIEEKRENNEVVLALIYCVVGPR